MISNEGEGLWGAERFLDWRNIRNIGGLKWVEETKYLGRFKVSRMCE